MGSVYVTNTNEETHTDRYDGEDYLFHPGERTLVPEDAACHMLGYRLLDKTETLVRLGKAMKYDPQLRNYGENPEGVRWLANFRFEEAVMTPRSLVPPLVAEPDIA